MAHKHQLRKQRTGTVINFSSKKQESHLAMALQAIEKNLNKKFKLRLHHEKTWHLKDIVDRLNKHFPNIPFHYHFEASHIKPDSGILSIIDHQEERYPILIAEVKNQGTNDLRLAEGKPRQAKGNAIERLGKNVIGVRAAMRHEGITPFVCFGDGCDFAKNSSILDRVTTIAMFGQLNVTNVVNLGDNGLFNRGSFYFREKPWTVGEMTKIMLDIATRSIQYYFARYGEKAFQ